MAAQRSRPQHGGGFFRTLWRVVRQVFHESTGAMFLILASVLVCRRGTPMDARVCAMDVADAGRFRLGADYLWRVLILRRPPRALSASQLAATCLMSRARLRRC